MVELDLLKLVADLGGLGIAGLVILLAYKVASGIMPKFLDLVSNHFKENAEALQALKDAVDRLQEYLKNNR